jgi:hypothetical protein
MAYPVGEFQGSRSSQTVVSSLQEVQVTPSLPTELWLDIFCSLNAEELAQTALVCKEWTALASLDSVSYRIPFPSWLKLIDASVWENHVDIKKYGLDITGAPRLNRRVITKALKTLSRKVENNVGIMMMFRPKGLTGNKVLQFAAKPKIGRPVPKDYIWPQILTEHGDAEAEQTQVIFFTNGIFKGTRARTPDQHELDVATIGQECGVTIRQPGFRDFMAFLALTYMSSSEDPPTQPYSSTYTRLIEKVDRLSLFGGFAPIGLIATECYPSSADDFGVGASGNSEDIVGL